MLSHKRTNRIISFVPLIIILGVLSWALPSHANQEDQNALIEASEINETSYPLYINWLDDTGKDPVDYIVDSCRKHDLVIIGEKHYVKDYCELFLQALPDAYHKAGVRMVGLEVCNAEINDKLSLLIEGDQYDNDLAYEIARAQNWGLWGYKEYWDILEAVWILNKSLPAGKEHMRIVGIDKEMDFQLDALYRANNLKDPALIEKAKNLPDIYKRDDWLVENIEQEILAKGVKGIVLVGFNHSFTHYAQPILDKERKLEKEWPRMAKILYTKYGNRIFQIGLHMTYHSAARIDKEYKGGDVVLSGLIEDIMAARGNSPVGFDVVGSPFAVFRDSRCYYFHWQPKMSFADLSRGYIFMKPAKDLAPCTWMVNFVSGEMFEKSKDYYEFAYKRKFKNSREINKFLESGMKAQ